VITAIGGPPVSRDGARAAAQRELSKGIYHRYDEPWPLRVYRAIEHFIGRLANDVGKHAPGGGAGAVVIVIVLVVLLAFLRWRLGPMQRARRQPGMFLADTQTRAEDHRREAASAAGEGRWADAVIARTRAMARELEERGVVDVRPGRTADELAAEVARAHPSAGPSVRAATEVFDDVAYGGRPATAASYEVVVRADQAVQGEHRLVAVAT
jgi:hypothetical protein